ncbi:hypothetical protein TNCV_1044661 [Trichonephila clavipes]|nr:hypothetical protein TNCV_1044661 [Trichonephila clavipes]
MECRSSDIKTYPPMDIGIPKWQDDGQLPWSNLDFDGDTLSESGCEESEESVNVIDNIPVNPDIYVSKDDTEWIPYNNKAPGRFVTKQWSNKLRET